MKLGSIRELEGSRPVLRDPNASGPEVVYWVFPEISKGGRWANMTVIVPGRYGNEYPKTFGHYHGTNVNETYHLVEGDGILQLQSKYIDEKGEWIKDRVGEVYLVRVKPGEEVLITPEWGHSWSNVGNLPLLSFDDWRSGHSPSDYEDIKALQGLAYYLIDDGGQPKALPNPKYKNLPEPKWVSAEEFRNLKS